MMDYRIHSTKEYHTSELETLGWELTVCNALFPKGTPLRKIIRRDASYGELLSDHLQHFVPMEKVKHVIEIGGGYGYLMKDLQARNRFEKISMLDISPRLLHVQRETLAGTKVEYREEDFLDTDPAALGGVDLAILNENLGDFPVVTELGPEIFNTSEYIEGKTSKMVRNLFRRYDLKRPEAYPFNLNIGALQAMEKLCASGVPYIFLSEHSCEAAVPEPYRRYIHVSACGNPERIHLRGHDEFTIRFSHLESVARTHSYRTIRGPLADIIPFDFSDRLRFILSSQSVEKDEHEMIRHFVEDLYQYEYLLLIRETSAGGAATPACRRCGKCCLADFAAYVQEEDMERWRLEGRGDILGIIEREHAVWAGDHFVSSVDGRYLHGCPFLTWEGDRHACSIYETRPGICRRYMPGSSEICSQFNTP